MRNWRHTCLCFHQQIQVFWVLFHWQISICYLHCITVDFYSPWINQWNICDLLCSLGANYIWEQKNVTIFWGQRWFALLYESSNKMCFTALCFSNMSLTLMKYLLSMPCTMVSLRKTLFLDVNDEQLIQHWLRWQELLTSKTTQTEK